ncbi:uncharacterized protein AMSG_02363 [Thecamonas trahens ATCC 50062]|uniref:FHA domain-containing protein n=1 Tax=Thecamonas trahens ATCC 50062 TaxID=461836 RepID=A0A0L0DVP7_THETB|nr:hypothetical protein AMSG_02363 [Thecamonas trahens ATCC 50062]KNC56394.1 hypothetical protein AMSG_02363 [Thecamonas trahens ATCC 50062]|eukprot:XP_013760908.1 hypothetical protein AMSG_02363 [Thecamonas trahens ATCC 50062]
MDAGSNSGTFFKKYGEADKEWLCIGTAEQSPSQRKKAGRTLHEGSQIKCGSVIFTVLSIQELTQLMVQRQLVLEVIRGESAGKTFLMRFRDMTIGRRNKKQPECTNEIMVVKDSTSSVSRAHCRIRLERSHSIEDLSASGTFVKRGPVSAADLDSDEGWIHVRKNTKHPLNHSDVIRLAESVFILVSDPSKGGPVPNKPDPPVCKVLSPTSIHLSWADPPSPASDATLLPIRKFKVTRATGTPEDWTAIIGGLAYEWTEDGLTPDTTYHFRVQAQNDVGLSSHSDIVTISTPPADADAAASPADASPTASERASAPDAAASQE